MNFYLDNRGLKPSFSEYITNAFIYTNNTVGFKLVRAINVSAPRLLQPVPRNPLPGVTRVLGVSGFPRRNPVVRRSPVRLPTYDRGHITP